MHNYNNKKLCLKSKYKVYNILWETTLIFQDSSHIMNKIPKKFKSALSVSISAELTIYKWYLYSIKVLSVEQKYVAILLMSLSI